MKIPWPPMVVFGVSTALAIGCVNSILAPMAAAPVDRATNASGTPTTPATATMVATVTLSPAPPTTNPLVATAMAARSTSDAALVASNQTADARATQTSDARVALEVTWAMGAAVDADAKRNAEIESVQLANAQTAAAMTAEPTHARETQESVVATAAVVFVTEQRAAVVAKRDDETADIVAEAWKWGLTIAAFSLPIMFALGISNLLGAAANHVERWWVAEQIKAHGQADADRTRAEAYARNHTPAPARDVPVNATGPRPTVLTDVEQWDRRLVAFMKQSILLSDGAGAAATIVTPANNAGWNSRAEWFACVTEMERRHLVVRVPGSGGGTTFTNDRTAGDVLQLLMIGTNPPPHPTQQTISAN